MTYDPTAFNRMVVTDTCSIWNMLSSLRLFGAAERAKISFLTTEMVIFECSDIRHTPQSEKATQLSSRLSGARAAGHFAVQSCSLDDLSAVAEFAPRGLGAGEISCIAVAYGIRTLAVMTDDKKARSFAKNRLHLKDETTPRLYGYLHYHGYLSDSHHQPVMEEHEFFEGRPLTKFLNIAYQEAMRCRLIDGV